MRSFGLKKKETVPHCVLSDVDSFFLFFLAALIGKEKLSNW